MADAARILCLRDLADDLERTAYHLGNAWDNARASVDIIVGIAYESVQQNIGKALSAALKGNETR